ncbi:MAG: exodeoxyribonuclease V subunit gamma [bacterium]
MVHFKIFSSNRVEILFEYLARVIEDTPLPSPLDQEVIVVESQGMNRWLSMMLAQRFGIWANAHYPFPKVATDELIHMVLPDFSDDISFEPRFLSFRIMKCLSACAQKTGFESIRNYLGDEHDMLKCVQLSEQLARIFDQYTMYRPELILKWEMGEESHWQAQLWRELIKEGGGSHKAAIRKKFFDTVAQSHVDPDSLPHRISIFGIPFLQPMHLEIFAAMSRYHALDVNLFLMNPCKEFWFDIVSEKTTARIQKKYKNKIVPPEELYYEIGNPLLASLGKHGAHLYEKILSDIPNVPEERRFEDPGQERLLECIQSDILNLRKRTGENTPKKIIGSDDDSVTIQVCHSPMREVEVLYDHILDLFEHKPDCLPGEILVMTPDIERYAPYISAVFSNYPDDEKNIPCSIADRSARKEGRLIDTFIKILDLYGSRFGVTQVMDIIETPALKVHTDLGEEGIDCVRRWVEKTRIRWGIDGADRRCKGLPYFEENSWLKGLERLVLGYALPGGDERMFGEILPYDDIEGKDARFLGDFLDFMNNLFHQIKELESPRTLIDWASALREILEKFFIYDTSTDEELHLIEKRIMNFAEIEEVSQFDDTIEFEVIRSCLTDYLNRVELSRGFLTGGITFCTMLPMRGIPFRIIMLIGMNDGSFPRLEKPKGFDLMARFPKKGDPSKREEDRYIFLEAILSAREQLYISYVGLSIQDNSQIPPAVVVSELLDTIEKDFEPPDNGKKSILDQIITNHFLQAFNHAYFQSEGPFFSYSEENCRALLAHADREDKNKLFLRTPLADPPVEFKTITLEQLGSFFMNPARYFLQHRLGMKLENLAAPLCERESFYIEGLDRYLIKQAMTQKELDGHNLNNFYTILKAQGVLPPGNMGLLTYEELCAECKEFADRVRPHIQEQERVILDIDMEISGFRIKGRIKNSWSKGLYSYRCAKVKAKDLLNSWVEHLALNYCKKTGYPQLSILIGSDTIWRFRPVDECRKILEELLNLYWEGMHRVLPFFPETSLKYAETLDLSGGDRDKALLNAGTVWKNNFSLSEADDPNFDLCFGKLDNPLDEDFQSIACTIFQPILQHREKV